MFRDNLLKKEMNCCGTVRQNWKGTPQGLGRKNLKLKWGDIQVWARSELTALIWKDRRDVNMFSNMHYPPAERNFCNGNRNAVKPVIAEDYNTWAVWAKETISSSSWKCETKLFFQLLDPTILNIYILSASCYKEIFHREFCLCLIRIREKCHGQEECGRPANVATLEGRLDMSDSKHGLLCQIGYAFMCARRAVSSVNLVSGAKSLKQVCVWIKTVFWIIT
jgi:hypothetical protein